MYVNVRDFIWHESFSINQQRIEHSYYTNVWKTNRETAVLEWKTLRNIHYSPDTVFEHTTWVKVFRSTGERVYPEGGGKTEEGTSGRAIHFFGGEKDVRLVLEKQYFDSSRPEFLGTVWSWIFGTEDYKTSAEEEARLKAAINKFMPETPKDNMSLETKTYFAGAARAAPAQSSR